MNRLKKSLLPGAAALLFFAFSASAQQAQPEDAGRLGDAIESRIRRSLPPEFDVSVPAVKAVSGGFEISGASVSRRGETVASANSVFIGYKSALSVLLGSPLSSAEIGIEGLKAVLPPPGGDGGAPSGSASPPSVPAIGIPRLKVTDSLLLFRGREIAIHNARVSFAPDEESLKVSLADGRVSLPDMNVSVSDLALHVLLAPGGPEVLTGAEGNGVVETQRGTARAEFDVSAPGAPDSPWEGSVSVSDAVLWGRKSGLSLSSVTLEKDGELSILGNVFMGGISSNVRMKVEAPGASSASKREFEFVADVFKRELPAGGIKFTGSLRREDGAFVISGNVPKNYRNALDLFGVKSIESYFLLALKGGEIDPGRFMIKSRNFLVEAEARSHKGDITAQYKVEADDVFYLSDMTRALNLYEMTGSVKSEGVFERLRGGEMSVSGSAEAGDFSFSLRGKKLGLEEGKFDFHIPLPLRAAIADKVFLESSVREFSYGDTVAGKAGLKLAEGKAVAKAEFKDSAAFDIEGEVSPEGARVDKFKAKAGDSSLALSRPFSVKVSDGMVDVEAAEMFGDKSVLRFQGSYGNGAEQPEIKVVADFLGVSTRLFEPFYPPLFAHRGIIDGSISVDGAALWPAADLNVRYRGASGDGANLRVVRRDSSERMSFNLLIDGGRGFLDLSGGLSPAAGESPRLNWLVRGPAIYDLNLKAEDFTLKPLALLSDKIRNLDGGFSGNLTVFKAAEGIDMRGKVNFDSARVKVGDWTEVMEVEFGELEFDGGSIHSSLGIRDPFGTALLNGTFKTEDFSYSGEAALDGIFLHISHLYSGFLGTLFVDGTGRNIRIRAEDLKTRNANIWLRKEANLEVGGLVYVDSPDSAAGEKFAEGKDLGFFTQTSDLDFRLRISDDTRFRLDRVNSVLSGDLRIIMQPGNDFSSVEGELNVIRGSYTLLGKQFDIDRGSISLSAREHLMPIVDINALYERTGLSVKAGLHGEADALGLTLSSVPAMKEDEIILALLTRGKNDRAIDIADAVDGRRENGGYSAFGYAADQLFSSLVESNPLGFVDVFSITRRGGGILESEIEAGTYITDRLYTTYQRVSETPLPISTSYRSRFVARYLLSDHFTVEGVAGGLTPGVDLIFNIDFR